MTVTFNQLVDPAGADLHISLYFERHVESYAKRHIRLYTDNVSRRVEEGRSKAEILRMLKRYIAREVYRHLPRG